MRKWKMGVYPFAIQRYPHYIMTCNPVLYGWIFLCLDFTLWMTGTYSVNTPKQKTNRQKATGFRSPPTKGKLSFYPIILLMTGWVFLCWYFSWSSCKNRMDDLRCQVFIWLNTRKRKPRSSRTFYTETGYDRTGRGSEKNAWAGLKSGILAHLKGQPEFFQIFAQAVGVIGRIALFTGDGKEFFPASALPSVFLPPKITSTRYISRRYLS